MTRTLMLALALVVLPLTAHATTLIKLDLKALTAKSEQIVLGRVLTLTPKLEGGRVFTYVSIKVSERLKGQGEDTVTLRLVGGRTEELATLVAGQANFRPGEDVLVFLERPGMSRHLLVTGMSQGKFRIVTGPDGATRQLVPQGVTTSLLAPTTRRVDGKERQSLLPAAPSKLHTQVTSLQDVRSTIQRQLR